MIFEMVAALIFFGMDGHHVFFTTLDGSFGKYPVGESLPNLPIRELTAMASFSEEWGLMLAAPVGLCLFLTSVSVALMARAAPQLNLYSFGLPLRLGVGLAALVLLLPQGINSLLNFFGQMQTWLAWLV
jgi:flagellar biosynthetic protein FliR